MCTKTSNAQTQNKLATRLAYGARTRRVVQTSNGKHTVNPDQTITMMISYLRTLKKYCQRILFT